MVEVIIAYLIVTLLNVLIFKYGIPKTSLHKEMFDWFEVMIVFMPLINFIGLFFIILEIMDSRMDVKKIGKWLN